MNIEPNPIQSIWYAATTEPCLDAPCYGCRKGWRRAYTMHDDSFIDYHHLVREGVTVDCTGTSWRVDQLLLDAEVPEMESGVGCFSDADQEDNA